jgi:Trk K+ transport system NAD-binding subunit
MADTDAEQVKLVQDTRITTHHIADVSAEGLAGLVNPALDALVVMTGHDELNLQACELAYEIGVPRQVARLNDYALAEQFTNLGVHVVNPSSAMVHLLDQFVRSPQTAALVMEEEPGSRQVAQITITDADYDNIRLRELRLPDDILVLGILRDGTSIMPHGHTILKLHDEVTLLGSPESLEQVTLRLGF